MFASSRGNDVFLFGQSMVELAALLSMVTLGAVSSLVFAVSPEMAMDAVCGEK